MDEVSRNHLDAARDVDESKLVRVTDIARAEKAVSVDGRRSVARVVEVTHEDMPSAHQNLTTI